MCIFQADLRNLLFQVCPYVSTSRPRHGAVKRKSRGRGNEDLSFTSDFHLNIKLLQRSATTFKNGGVSSNTPTKTQLAKSSSSKSY